ncbi:MAG TPA: GNAT family N-acetyltransferase [Opitutaceae bacterium]|jgi:GNAT superfamily N-acetyltransferase|nr:GNAT family N-acetyltransferase [Opitutaceae bacterium]
MSSDDAKVPKKVTIREATIADVPLILYFVRELAIYEKLFEDVEATDESLKRTLFPESGPPAVAKVLIGELDGKPEGFTVYFFNYSTFLSMNGIFLEDLFVKPASRGYGLGKALLLALAKIAVERGCGRMDWSVLDWNKPSIEFYKALGAVAMDDWTTFRLTGDALTKLGKG